MDEDWHQHLTQFTILCDEYVNDNRTRPRHFDIPYNTNLKHNTITKQFVNLQ